MSDKRLLSALSRPKVNNERLKKIREDLDKSRYNFSKSEIRDQKKSLRNREAKNIFQHKQ